jgi:hypothetical protein
MKNTTTAMRGGCFVCHGDKTHWTAKNTVGVAARHHDVTGHETWIVVQICTTYSKSFSKRKPKGFIQEQ